jgi:hypothetical protein
VDSALARAIDGPDEASVLGLVISAMVVVLVRCLDANRAPRVPRVHT